MSLFPNWQRSNQNVQIYKDLLTIIGCAVGVKAYTKLVTLFIGLTPFPINSCYEIKRLSYNSKWTSLHTKNEHDKSPAINCCPTLFIHKHQRHSFKYVVKFARVLSGDAIILGFLLRYS